MQWEFSADDVVKAHVDYGLLDFRRDLGEELRRNLGPMDEARATRTFNLVYDLCYALATDKKFDEFLTRYAFDPPTCEFLTEIKPHMADNVVMLGAILQRQIMDRVEAHMPLASAIDDVAQWHAALVAGKLPDPDQKVTQ